MTERRLDLSSPRDLGELLSTTFALFRGYTGVFVSVTAVVVIPYVVLVDGVWGHRLAHGSRAHAPGGWFLADVLIGSLLVPAMVTALHAVIVRDLGRGREPTVNSAMAAAAERLWPAIAAVALFGIGCVVGLLLLVIPGIWLAVRWYFAAQAAVIDRETPAGALRRSAELVRGHWWRTLGVLIVAWIVFGLVVLPLTVATYFVHQGVLYTVIAAIALTISRSLTALFGTLLFFDLRARREPQPEPLHAWLPPVDPSQA